MVCRWAELMDSMLADLKEPLMAVLMVDHLVEDLADLTVHLKAVL